MTSPAHLEQMLTRRAAGDTFAEIAAAFGYSNEATVWKVLEGSPGLVTAAQSRAARDRRLYLNLLDELDAGHDLHPAADRLEVSVAVAHRVLHAGQAPGIRDAAHARIVAQIQTLLGDGLTIEDASASLGLTVWAARAALIRAGLEMPPSTSRRSQPAPDPAIVARNEAILAARARGLSMDEIGRQHGVTRERVRQILVKAGGPSNEDVRAARAAVEQERLAAIGERIHARMTELGTATHQQIQSDLGISADDMRAAIWESDRRLLRMEKPPTEQYSDETIMAGLVACSRERGAEQGVEFARVSKDFWDQWRDPETLPSSARIMQRYHSWNNACSLAGIPVLKQEIKSGPAPRWTDDDLVVWVARFLAHPDGGRSFQDYTAWAQVQPGAPSSGTIRVRLGRWNHARHLAATLTHA